MDLRRLRPGEWVLSAAAIVLLVSLFLPWYEIERTGIDSPALALRGHGFGPTYSAWQAFSVLDIVFLLCVVVILGAVALQATQRSPALPVLGSVAAGWASLIVFALTLWRALDPPSLDIGGADFDVLTPDYGVWVGLAAAVGLVAGAWWAIRDDKPGFAPKPAPR